MVTLQLDATPPAPYVAPVLDADQQRVVAHRRGAMRVLAGPGTGKTTTLVAAMAGRLQGADALDPGQVLGLTFGRRAALSWRDAVSAAVGGGLVPTVSTFHSFCYALLRKFAPNEAYFIATRLLSGPEQQVRARALFQDAVAEGRIAWPEDLMEAVGTRGLAEEIRTVMARTRSHAMDPVDLARIGVQGRMPLWESVAEFMDEYLDVLGFEGVLDYSELIYRTMLLCDEPEVQAYLHQTFAAVYVDEYQDTDPGQIELLRRMVTASTTLVVVGDFDQGIYGFRGADEAGIRLFREQFADIYGDDMHDVVLRTCRRFGANMRAAADAVIAGYQPLRIDKSLVVAHRAPTCMGADAGEVSLRTFDSDGSQASHIADMIVREHAAGRAWSDMAVIVRSASASLPPIYRALISAGVPTEVATDEIPIHEDPAVAPLLTALRVIDDAHVLTPDVAQDILTGPLAGVDPVDLRRFGRFLRDRDQTQDRAPRSSSRLVAQALGDPDALTGVTSQRHGHLIDVVAHVARTLAQAREAMRAGASPHQVLWQVWDSSPWPARLQAQALAGGMSSQRAHRDLDAVCALFDYASRFVSRGGAKGLTSFLDELMAQQIPGETLAENDLRGDCVRVLTAHRAKGLEWPFVVVAAVQEGLWPNLVVPATVLQPERIGPGHVAMPQTVREMLDAERRLFFVAMTRAKQRVVVTSVDTSDAESGVRKSRFIEELLLAAGRDTHGEVVDEAVPTLDADVQRLVGRPRRSLNADSIVAQLRAALDDDDESVRAAAAVRLARLAASGVPHFRTADPATWWGALPRTQNDVPTFSSVRLSGSAIDAIERCPARWYLERHGRAVVASQSRMVFGSALHKIAEALATGAIAPEPGAIEEKLDRIWPEMAYDVAWEARREREQAHDAAARLLSWFLDHAQAEAHVETDLVCRASVPRADGTGDLDVVISGRVDRLEISADGAVVYDFKTGTTLAKSALDLARNLQLALYEFMLRHGTYEVDGTARELEVPVAATALVQLRFDDLEGDGPLVQQVAAGAHDKARNVVPLELRIAAAAEVMDSEVYPTRYEDKQCARCDVRFMCPAMPEGRPML